MFEEIYQELRTEGYFDEYLGWLCVDMGNVDGKIRHPARDIMLKTRKEGLWPIEERFPFYSKDDLMDVIEYLYSVISKPIEGNYHSYSDCGMHWETFNKSEGELYFIMRMNELFGLYKRKFEILSSGEVVEKPEQGFEQIFEADTPTKDKNIENRITSAVGRYRRHGASVEDRRLAVRDLADVLEYLRPNIKKVLTSKDESDLFNLVNNFGIRHHNEKQKTMYDQALWQSWMFYFFLATIHVVLKKINSLK